MSPWAIQCQCDLKRVRPYPEICRNIHINPEVDRNIPEILYYFTKYRLFHEHWFVINICATYQINLMSLTRLLEVKYMGLPCLYYP